MEYEFTKSFDKDLESYKHDREFLRLLGGKVNEIGRANSFEDITGLVPIRGRETHYRFKIKTRKTTYRVGIKLLTNRIWFARLDKDKRRFYKRFK